MDFLATITEDIKNAMKAGEKEKLSALRMAKAALIENKTSAAPKAEQDVLIGYAKKLAGTIENFPEGDINRQKIKNEIAFLKSYLPEQMDEATVVAMINDIVAKGAANQGMVMKELSPLIKGKFDGKRANELVTTALKK